MGLNLEKELFEPDIIVAYSGWGLGMAMKDVWSDSKFVGFFEWYYNSPGPDYSFLNKKLSAVDHRLTNRIRNAPLLMDLAQSDFGLCPIGSQKKQFPSVFYPTLVLQHNGIDTDYFSPLPSVDLKLPGLNLEQTD